MGLPSWTSLVSAFAARQAVLTSGLGLKLQRALAQVCLLYVLCWVHSIIVVV